MKFRKKPVMIDAMQYDGFNREQIMKELGMTKNDVATDKYKSFLIRTLEGTRLAKQGDWIVKGVKGEFYPVKPDIFEATYEIVEASP